MAKLEKQMVNRNIEVEDEVETIQLELSFEEAKVLYAILHYVGGDPDNSPRKHSGNILKEVGRVLHDKFEKPLRYNHLIKPTSIIDFKDGVIE